MTHYGKAFNLQFLAKYCLKNKVHAIYQGNKHIFMKTRIVRFIDCTNFTLLLLRKFSKTFGLNLFFLNKLAKGHYFFHLFNNSKNKKYVGKYPENIPYNGYDSISEEEK